MADTAFAELGTADIWGGADSRNSATSTIANVSVGDYVVAYVHRDYIGEISGVSATGFGPWTLIGSHAGINNFGARAYIAQATSSAASRVVDVSFAAARPWGTFFTMRYAQNAGLVSLTPLDVSYNPTAATGFAASSTVRGSGAADLVIPSGKSALVLALGSDYDYFRNQTGANGFTARVDSDTFGADATTAWAYDAVKPAGTYGGTAAGGKFGDASGTDQYMAMLVAFELVAGGGISGTATGGQGTQSVSSSGKQTAVGTGTSSQKSESASAVGSQIAIGTATSGQGSQTSASAGSGYLSATIAASQASQTSSVSGTQTAVGVGTAGQGSQTSAASAGESITGTIVAGQGGQTSSVVGSGYIPATVTAGQGSQTSSIVGQQTSVGVGTGSQKSQSVTGTATVGAGFRLYWDDITGEDGYRVKWGTSSGNYTSSVDVAADVTFVDIWGLAANTLYYWIVVGLLSGVEQTPSSESTFNTYPTTGTSGQGSQTTSGAAKQTTIGIATSGQGSQRVDGIGSPGTSISGTITAGQGSQSVSSIGYLQLIGLVSAGQGSQSVTAASEGVVATVSAGQGAQSIIAAGNIVIPGQVAVSQGSQSVGGSATITIVGTCSSGQGTQYAYGTTIPLGELVGIVSRMLMGMGR